MSQSNTAPPQNPAPDPRRAGRAAELVSVVLGLVLLFSAVAKMLAPQSFLEVIRTFGLLPPGWVLAFGTGLVGVETALGVLLVTGAFRRAAAWWNLMLMLVFLALMGMAIQRGYDHCGCYGELVQLRPAQEIWVNVFLLLLTAFVLWRGKERRWGEVGLRHGVAWGSLALGGFLFLLGGPAPAAAPSLELHEEDLAVLESADPPLQIPPDGLLFFFSADCDHCWAYAGAVQMAQDRLRDFEVRGVTFSEDYALAEFREFFAPTYPIHRISQRAFLDLMPDFPGAVWIQNGRLARAWGGHVPSHREIAELGGYDLVEAPAVRAPAESSGGAGLFGGPATERH